MRALLFAPIAASLLWSCSQPTPPPVQSPNRVAAVESRLSADEARIAALDGRLQALETAKSVKAAPTRAAPAARTYTLTETTKPEDEPATTTRAKFETKAECETARQKALADAATRAQADSKTKIETLPNGAAMITPGHAAPTFSAICSG